MKKNLFRATVAAMIAAVATSAPLLVHASTFSVTSATSGSTTTFTVTRDSADASETVLYRTVSRTALDGVHFAGASGTLTFAAGVTNMQVAVFETPVDDVSLPSRCQTGTTRTYRFEVLDDGGFRLAYTDREISFGTAWQLNTDRVVLSVTDLVYFNNSAYATGVGSSRYVDVAYTPPSSDVETSGALQGYVLIDDSYDYSRKAATVSTSALFAHVGGTGPYHDAIGNKMYATVCFTEKEQDDGYAYVQIVAGNGGAAYDGSDPDGKVNDPSNSLYKACFELKKGSPAYDGEGKQFFPHRHDYVDRSAGGQSASYTEFFLAEGYLWQHKFKDTTPSCRASASGSLVLSPTVTDITTRFDCAGGDDDTFGYKDLFVRLAMVDGVAPTLTGVTVSPGLYRHGNEVSISLVFSEAVAPFYSYNTGRIVTSWGHFKNIGNTGVNVITFTGVVNPSTTNGKPLVIESFLGVTVKDLAGNAFDESAIANYSIPSVAVDASSRSYAISYDLAGGELPPGASNPTTYSYDTPSFTLVNPTGSPGYFFAGWIGTGLDSVSTNVRVIQAHGDRSYTAVWMPIAYPIAYDGATNGVAGVSNPNPTSYTVEDGDVALANPTRTGYTFVGWFADAGRTTPAPMSFPASDMEPKAFYAAWTPVTYIVRFDPNGGSGAMPDQTLTYDAPAALASNAFTRGGYVFAGWNVAGTAGQPIRDRATVGNLTNAQDAVVTLVAQWEDVDWEAEGRSGDTPDDAYLIYTTRQLDLLASRVNGGNDVNGNAIDMGNDYEGKYFRLMADLAYDPDIEGNFVPIGSEVFIWTPIGAGTVVNPFRGNFDGNGHTVSGIRANFDYRNSAFLGVFGILQDGSVKNLTLADAVFSNAPGSYGGGIVARMDSGTVQNCFVTGSAIVANDHAGSIIGYSSRECAIVGNAYHGCAVRSGDTSSTYASNVGTGGDPDDGDGPHDIDGGAEACYAVAAEGGAVVASEPDFAFPVFGVTNRYWKAGSSVRLEYAGALAAGQTVKFTVNGEPLASDVFTMPAADVTVGATVINGDPQVFTDPQGVKIGDQALVEWLSANNFTQSDINALGSDAAATYKLYECWLLNCSITAENPGGALSITDFAVSTNEVSVTVQLVRQSPLGYIIGELHLYGADDLATDFGLIDGARLDFGDGDSTFAVDSATVQASGSVTQTVIVTFDTSFATEKFFKAAIEFPQSEDSGEDPEE